MRKYIASFLIAMSLGASAAPYTPTAENIKARQEFADNGFGVFIH